MLTHSFKGRNYLKLFYYLFDSIKTHIFFDHYKFRDFLVVKPENFGRLCKPDEISQNVNKTKTLKTTFCGT